MDSMANAAAGAIPETKPVERAEAGARPVSRHKIQCHQRCKPEQQFKVIANMVYAFIKHSLC